jgi:hypothetical protein
MLKGTVYDEDGNELEDEDIVPDGGFVRVPTLFMDGQVPLEMQEHVRRAFEKQDTLEDAEAAAQDAYEARSKRLRNAWRTVPPWQRVRNSVVKRGAKVPIGGTASAGDADTNKDAAWVAYQAYVRRLSDAWKQP